MVDSDFKLDIMCNLLNLLLILKTLLSCLLPCNYRKIKYLKVPAQHWSYTVTSCVPKKIEPG
ncbi:hypothetical protein V1478_009706 [Vespula squamosa]|uniref:Uncharacterized protein n=1 Tax=Vespula squamosa TaxID=30214 RepID=A0ABD2AQF0_VESSQ